MDPPQLACILRQDLDLSILERIADFGFSQGPAVGFLANWRRAPKPLAASDRPGIRWGAAEKKNPVWFDEEDCDPIEGVFFFGGEVADDPTRLRGGCGAKSRSMSRKSHLHLTCGIALARCGCAIASARAPRNFRSNCFGSYGSHYLPSCRGFLPKASLHPNFCTCYVTSATICEGLWPESDLCCPSKLPPGTGTASQCPGAKLGSFWFLRFWVGDSGKST